MKPNFQLIETLRYQPGIGFLLFDAHKKRLWRSAKRFGFVLDWRALERLCQQLRTRLPQTHDSRVRITLATNGQLECQHAPLTHGFQSFITAQGGAPTHQATLATHSLNTRDSLLHYKTSSAHIRRFYDDTWKRAQRQGFDEVFFVNTCGQLTEGSRSNIVLAVNNRLITPPLADGCLAGLMRDEGLRQQGVRIQSCSRQTLSHADAVYAINSVNGWLKMAIDRGPNHTP